MNVPLPFQNEGWSFYGLLGVMVVVAVVFIYIFKRRKWM